MLYLIDIDVVFLSGYNRGYLLPQFDHSPVSLGDIYTRRFFCFFMCLMKESWICVNNYYVFPPIYYQFRWWITLWKLVRFRWCSQNFSTFIFNIVNIWTVHTYTVADILKKYYTHTEIHRCLKWFSALQMFSVSWSLVENIQ